MAQITTPPVTSSPPATRGDNGSADSKEAPQNAFRRRLEMLRAQFAGAGVEALLINRDCDIAYFTGFCGHDSLLLVTASRAYCISDNRYDEQLNPVRASELATVIMGVRHRLHESVGDLCASHGLARLGIQAEHLTVAARSRLATAVPGTAIVETQSMVGRLRMRKDAIEIAAIERAIRINEAALAATLPHITLGMTERDISARLEYEMKRGGAFATGFRPIVAVGAHGSLPHYETADAPLVANTSLLIDWGCSAGGYNSDLTRTFGVGAMPSKIREIYQIVLDAQLAAIEAIAPGKICAEIDAVARRHIARHGYGEYFGHGLGHGMGMEVHEPPFFNNLQTDVPLEPGIVMTVEPGIYLPGVGGVRIEDDIVVTERGCRVLSSFKKTLADVQLAPGGPA